MHANDEGEVRVLLPFQLRSSVAAASLLAGMAGVASSQPVVIASDYAGNNDGRLLSFALTEPEDPRVLASLTAPTFLLGVETFEPDSHAALIGLSSDHRLWRIDVPSGQQTEVGLASIPFPENWAGLARDPTTGELFAAANCFFPCSTSRLYRVAADYQSVILVGDITNIQAVIAIAFDNQGRLYAMDVVADQLLSIDPQTGAGTPIGPLGFDANFGQGMDFDRTTNELYIFAFNFGTSRAELRGADLETGQTELVGPIGDATTFTVKGVVNELPPPTVEVPALRRGPLLALALLVLVAGLRTLRRRASGQALATSGVRP